MRLQNMQDMRTLYMKVPVSVLDKATRFLKSIKSLILSQILYQKDNREFQRSNLKK